MKTYEQMIDKAVLIAWLDKNAYVGVFVPRQAVAEYKFDEGVYKSVQNRWVSESGGVVQFFSQTEDLSNTAGFQFTHIFVSERIGHTDQHYLRSRLRSANKPHPEPMGFYHVYGFVERLEDW